MTGLYARLSRRWSPMLRENTEGPRVTLTIDEPEKRNPLTNETVADLIGAVQRAASDETVRVIVITGAGDRAFSAGGDLSGGFINDPLASHGDRSVFPDLFRALRRCGKPTIARVNGHALAGGFGLAAGCDIVIAADTATFGTPEIDVGLWPMMITAVLQRLMPRQAALELMMTGRRIGADEALRLGVVGRVVAPDELDAAVDDTVEKLLAASPAQLRLGKDAFYAVEDMAFDAALDHLQAGLTSVGLTEDAAEGIAAFREKRSPDWKGR